MNPSDHPSIDQIADLQAGLLPAAEAAALRAHLDECSQCQDTLALLAGVTDVLAAEGARSPSIPPDVSARIAAALAEAEAERSAGVPSLAERRAKHQSPPARRAYRWILGAAAAAAAIVAVGASLSVLGGDNDTDDAGVSAESAAEDSSGGSGTRSDHQFQEAPSGELETPGDVAGLPTAFSRLDPQTVQLAAQRYASGRVGTTSPRGECALLADDLGDHLLVTQYGGGSERALLLVDEAQGTYRLVDCDTGALITKGEL